MTDQGYAAYVLSMQIKHTGYLLFIHSLITGAGHYGVYVCRCRTWPSVLVWL